MYKRFSQAWHLLQVADTNRTCPEDVQFYDLFKSRIKIIITIIQLNFFFISSLSFSQHCTENGSVTPLDDGLPDFYSKRVLPDR